MNKTFQVLLIFLIILSFISCSDELPLDKDLTKKSYLLINQDSMKVEFPKVIKGNITVIGFIYTNCPDICPMTAHNMYLTEQKLKEEGIENVKFVALSFDPGRDSPIALRKFAEIRDINFKNWMLLTGEKNITKDLLRRFDIIALPTDSSFSDEGSVSYFMMHTDRISLIDKNGKLRKNYKGSTVNLKELYNDIKYLGEE